MPLTDLKIRNAKPGAKPVKLSDGEGLQLVVTPAGGKSWKLAYRFDGRQKELTIGPYPAIGLQDARQRRDEAKRHLADGLDPSTQKRVQKAVRADTLAVTFQLVATEVLEKKRREGKATQTLAKTEWLHAMACEVIGQRPITEITAAEVLAALRRVEARGRLETAARLRSAVGEVFRFAIATARASNDPTFALRGALDAPKVRHRAAILDGKALGALLRSIDAFDGQPTTIAALKLMALLFPRPGELRMAEWSEIDMETAIWTIPATRTKMRREHRVPLPPRALSILRDLQAITGRGRLVLPGYGTTAKAGRPIEARPISENTLNSALRRMGYGPDEMSAHGFRAAASTLMNESGLFHPDAIERALAHQDKDAIRRAYARGEHWAERVRLMGWWADQLDAWREGGKVLPMVRA
jgi:integrase